MHHHLPGKERSLPEVVFSDLDRVAKSVRQEATALAARLACRVAVPVV
jgi:hypothetical protein